MIAHLDQLVKARNWASDIPLSILPPANVGLSKKKILNEDLTATN